MLKLIFGGYVKLKAMLLILLVPFIQLSCTTKKIISHPVNREVIVDGNFKDWNVKDLVFNEQPPFMIGATNSKNRLYLIFRSNDVTFMHRLRTFGFILWLNRDKTMGLQFPGRFRGAPDNRKNTFAEAKWKKRKERVSRMMNTEDFFLKIKKGEEKIPLSSVNGFSVASAEMNGVHTIEFAIPISQKHGEKKIIMPKNGKLALGLQFKGLSKNPDFQRSGRGHGGQRGMGTKGSGKQKNRGRQNGIDEKELWFDIILQSRLKKPSE